MATKILKKLTLRTFIGTKDEILAIAQSGAPTIPNPENPDGKIKGKPAMIYAPGRPVDLCTVLGHVTEIKAGEHKETGAAFVKLMGNFKATNLITGEVVPDCGMAILPNFVSTPIAGAVRASNGAPVSFGVKLQVKFSPTSAVGYEFEAETLMPAQQSDAISAIEAQIASLGIALPAPAATAAPKLNAPAPAAAAAKKARK